MVGNPLTFTGVALDVSGASVAITNPESITGRSRSTVFGWTVQVTQDGDVYKLELVPAKGFHLYIR